MPKHLIPHTNDRSYQRLVNKVLEAHSTLAQSNVIQLQFDFLQFCWKQKVYGCTFFKALMHRQHVSSYLVNIQSKLAISELYWNVSGYTLDMEIANRKLFAL